MPNDALTVPVVVKPAAVIVPEVVSLASFTRNESSTFTVIPLPLPTVVALVPPAIVKLSLSKSIDKAPPLSP